MNQSVSFMAGDINIAEHAFLKAAWVRGPAT
jgi:hypothetical protein